MKALTRSQRTRLLASGVPALGVALVRAGDRLFTARPAQAAPTTVDGVFVAESK